MREMINPDCSMDGCETTAGFICTRCLSVFCGVHVHHHQCAETAAGSRESGPGADALQRYLRGCIEQLAEIRMHLADMEARVDAGELRDMFAGRAMQGIITCSGQLSGWPGVATMAYDVADAMVEERERRAHPPEVNADVG
jgi:hypothetical protein